MSLVLPAKPRARVLLGLIVIAVTVAVGEGSRVFQLRALLFRLEARIDTMTAGGEALRKNHVITMRDLAAAQQQLAAIDQDLVQAERNGTTERNREIKKWARQVKKLHALFEERPDQKIPEMLTLSEAEWLLVAKTAELDTPDQIRAALARVRALAKNEFASKMNQALARFTEASHGTLPTSVSALGPYFSPPADPMILQRYEMHPALASQSTDVSSTSNYIKGPFDYLIREKDPIDDEYDQRTYVFSGGGTGSSSGVEIWHDDFRRSAVAASERFTREHPGARPTTVEDLVPYFDPPLSAEMIEKLKRSSAIRQ